MRFSTYRNGNASAWGAVRDGELKPLDHLFPSLRAAIEADALTGLVWETIDSAPLAFDQLQLLPVLPDPGKILCVGLNYEMHRQETSRPEVANPTIFTRFANSQTGHRAPIVLPPESTQLDYEGELAVVIGKGGRRIPQAGALDHVAGYSCYNDGSIRDWQYHTAQYTPGKNFPATGAFGPWLVTADEFGIPGPQTIETRLNGEVMQHARFENMIFPVTRLIEYCSTFTALEPGDVIVTGTPGGVGARRTPPVFMKAGDTVQIEIGGIGVLENHIVAET